MSRPRPALWLAALVLVSAVRAEIEFIGVLLMPARSTFALTEEPGKPATWHALGETFADYSLESFDAKTDTLTLTKTGAPPLRVRLKDDAKIKNARLEIAGALTLGEKEKVEFPRATLLFDQENVFPLKDGLVWRITPTRKPDGNILYDAILDRTSPDGKLERVSSPRIVALPASPFSVKVGDIEFSFAPKPN
jgi:hypothetical protein